MEVPRPSPHPRRRTVQALEVVDDHVHDFARSVDLAVHQQEHPVPRDRSKVLGCTTRCEVPVSSSSVMKMIPRAVAGRWRTRTMPATDTRSSFGHCASSCSAAAVRAPRSSSISRRNDTGWAFSDRLCVA